MKTTSKRYIYVQLVVDSTPFTKPTPHHIHTLEGHQKHEHLGNTHHVSSDVSFYFQFISVSDLPCCLFIWSCGAKPFWDPNPLMHAMCTYVYVSGVCYGKVVLSLTHTNACHSDTAKGSDCERIQRCQEREGNRKRLFSLTLHIHPFVLFCTLRAVCVCTYICVVHGFR